MSMTEGTDNLVVKGLVLSGQGTTLPNADSDGYTRLAGMFRETTSRFAQTAVFASNNSASSNRVIASALPLYADEQVHALTFVSGATAATSPTRCWACLYRRTDTGIVLFAVTPALAGGFGANTMRRFPFASTLTIPNDALYYAGLVQVASVPASMSISPTTVFSEQPFLTIRHDTVSLQPEETPQTLVGTNFGGMIYAAVD